MKPKVLISLDGRLVLMYNGKTYDITDAFAEGIKKYKGKFDIGIVKLQGASGRKLNIVETVG